MGHPYSGLDGARAARTSPPEQTSVLGAEPVQASTVTCVLFLDHSSSGQHSPFKFSPSLRLEEGLGLFKPPSVLTQFEEGGASESKQ